MARVKRTWVISYDASLQAPWLARPNMGVKISFQRVDQLVRFLIEGHLDVPDIRTAVLTVESGREAKVVLESR